MKMNTFSHPCGIFHNTDRLKNKVCQRLSLVALTTAATLSPWTAWAAEDNSFWDLQAILLIGAAISVALIVLLWVKLHTSEGNAQETLSSPDIVFEMLLNAKDEAPTFGLIFNHEKTTGKCAFATQESIFLDVPQNVQEKIPVSFPRPAITVYFSLKRRHAEQIYAFRSVILSSGTEITAEGEKNFWIEIATPLSIFPAERRNALRHYIPMDSLNSASWYAWDESFPLPNYVKSLKEPLLHFATPDDAALIIADISTTGVGLQFSQKKYSSDFESSHCVVYLELKTPAQNTLLSIFLFGSVRYMLQGTELVKTGIKFQKWAVAGADSLLLWQNVTQKGEVPPFISWVQRNGSPLDEPADMVFPGRKAVNHTETSF